MWDRYRRDLRKAVRASPGREKGLLVVNYEAECEIYGTSSLSLSTLREGVKDLSLPDDRRQFDTTLEAKERLSAHLFNIQIRYLQLRERLTLLMGIFFALKQNQFVENLLNDISWESGKRAAALRQRIIANSHSILLGDITLDEDEESEYIHIRTSDKGKEIAFKEIEQIREETLLFKTKIEVARGFMDKSGIRITAYEAYFNGIEGKLREFIRSVQNMLYRVDDTESWHEIREILVKRDDDFLRIMEALPDYDALVIDEDAYRKEEDILLRDRD